MEMNSTPASQLEDDAVEVKGVRRRKGRGEKPVITRVDDPNEAVPNFMRERHLGSRTASSSSWWAGMGASGTEHLREAQDPNMLRPNSLLLEETEFDSSAPTPQGSQRRSSLRKTAVDDATASALVRNATPSIRSRNSSYHHVADLDRDAAMQVGDRDEGGIEYDEPVLPGATYADPMAYSTPDRNSVGDGLYEVPFPSTGAEQEGTFQPQASGRSKRSSSRRRSGAGFAEDRMLAEISEEDNLHFARAGSQRDEDAIRDFQPTLLSESDDEMSRQASRKPHPLARQGSLRLTDL